jgi:uncharacterized protein (TIGR02444 family)
MSSFPDHPFWTFSTRLYVHDGVAAACLALQERHQLDVNILLFCIWSAAEQGRALSRDDMASVLDHVGAWHEEVVRQLRAVRQRMRNGAPGMDEELVESVRKRVLGAELECEHVEQLMLAGLLPEEKGKADCGAPDGVLHNISSFYAAAGYGANDADARDLAALLTPLFPDIEAGAVARALGIA